MFDMNDFWPIAIPSILLASVVLLRPLRAWLERVAERASQRTKMIDEFDSNAMLFLKLTDPVEHANSREVMLFAGKSMMDGAKLIRAILFLKPKSRVTQNSEGETIVEEMNSLSDDARLALATALGSALIVSSHQSLFFGGFYRSVLLLLLKESGEEIREPEQIVKRFGHNRKGRWNNHEATC